MEILNATAGIQSCKLPISNHCTSRYLLQWLGRKCLGFPAYKKSDDPPSADAMSHLHKFKESAYKCGVQTFFTILLLVVALPKPWFTNTWLYWADCSRLPCEAEPTFGERIVYLVELAFYAQAIPMIFLWETKRKDRWELFAHHVATVILIAYSYYLNITRVGVMVLVCHEANDIFLELAKMARYAEASETVTTGCFIAFMLSWFATRLYAFGFIVIKSTLFESYKRAEQVKVNIEPHTTILNGFLIFLYILHIYWSYLIVRIAVRQLVGGELNDIREEHDDEDEVEEKEDQVKEIAAGGSGRTRAGSRRAVKPAALNPGHVGSVGNMPSNM